MSRKRTRAISFSTARVTARYSRLKLATPSRGVSAASIASIRSITCATVTACGPARASASEARGTGPIICGKTGLSEPAEAFAELWKTA